MKESEIRPEHLHRRYLELSAQDAALCFGNGPRRDIPCVACGSSRVEPQFEKNGFGFALCSDCRTLYQSPRPSIETFENFYRDSVSSRYWAQEFFPAVAEARRASIFRPRVERLQALCAERGISVRRLIEVGSGFGIFLEEWRERSPGVELIAIEPSNKMAAVCREKGFAVAEDIVENVKGMNGHGDLVVCFEVLEHVYDPVSFLRTLGALVRPGGYVFISTLGADGFDIQTLWEKSNSISPPHHINFLSIEGFKRAFARAGFSDASVTTPGKLDVDIVRNADARNPSLLKDNHFARMVVRDAEKGALFQKFLAENLLSSHVWVLAKRET